MKIKTIITALILSILFFIPCRAEIDTSLSVFTPAFTPWSDMFPDLKSACFLHTAGDWFRTHAHGQGSLLCKQVSFQNTIEDSLIEKFTILGYSDGSRRISIRFDESRRAQVKVYLNAHYFYPEPTDLLLGFFSTDTSKQTKRLFDLLMANAEFPEEAFAVLSPDLTAAANVNLWDPH